MNKEDIIKDLESKIQFNQERMEGESLDFMNHYREGKIDAYQRVIEILKSYENPTV